MNMFVTRFEPGTILIHTHVMLKYEYVVIHTPRIVTSLVFLMSLMCGMNFIPAVVMAIDQSDMRQTTSILKPQL